MDTASSTTPAGTARPFSAERLVLRASTVCLLAVTVINLAVYWLGRMTDAGFVISPALGPQNLEVDAIKVAVTTVGYFAPGVALLVLAARRSSRAVRALAVVGALFAIASALGPLDAAHDQATGWVLAPMHLTTGAAFVLAAAWVHKRLATDGR